MVNMTINVWSLITSLKSIAHNKRRNKNFSILVARTVESETLYKIGDVQPFGVQCRMLSFYWERNYKRTLSSQVVEKLLKHDCSERNKMTVCKKNLGVKPHTYPLQPGVVSWGVPAINSPVGLCKYTVSCTL